MPFSRTLRIRSTRQRTATGHQKSSHHCTCGSLPTCGPSPLSLSSSSSSLSLRGEAGWTSSFSSSSSSSSATRVRGTTLGYVKSTWSDLVSRCDRGSRDDHLQDYVGTGASGYSMVKKRSAGVKTPSTPASSHHHHHNNNNNNNNNPKLTSSHLHKNGKSRSSFSSSSSSSSFRQLSHWLSNPTFIKVLVVILIAVIGMVFVFNDFGFSRSGREGSSSSSSSSSSSPSRPDSWLRNGGWREGDEATVKRFDSSTCNIDRIPVTQLDRERFERDFRYKRPVIVTFPNGAKDWTDPQKWTLDYLKRSYGEWKINSGDSLEIVRRGGNGDVTSSFDHFIDHMMEERTGTTLQPKYYMFDRTFYKDTELPGTLRLPPYFSNDEESNDSLFFLGTSGTGVVFHKHADTWNAVVYGKKRWFLYPMTKTPPGGVYHGFPIQDWYQSVYPNLTVSQRPLECVQQGGEILYLPEGFYHATLNIGDTIAVAQQRKQPTLMAEKLMYQVTALAKGLDDPNQNHQEINQKLLHNFIKLRELLPENAEMTMKLGEKYGDLGQHHTAVDLLTRALTMDPYFVLAYTALGTNLASLGRLDEAEEAMTRAMKLSPDAWDVYRDYGTFLMTRGRYRDAIPVLRKGTELKPGLLPFWSYLKAAQERTGDEEGARRSQEKMDQLNLRMQAQEQRNGV